MATQSSLQRTCPESLQLGLQHHQAGRLAQAEACYREILQQESQHPDALHLLGVIAQQIGRYDAAIQLISAAIERNPQAADYHNNLGNTYRLQGNAAAATTAYRQAVALDPALTEALHSLANVLADQNQFPEAEACFERLLQLQPDHADALYNLGNAKARQGDLPAAIACYRSALDLKPTCPEFHFNLARALQATGELQEAATALREAAALAPSDADTHHHLGIVLLELEDFPAAADAFHRTLTLRPDFPEALSNLAVALQQQDDYANAGNLLRRAIALKPSLAEAHCNLGGNLWRLGDLAGAVDSCRRAVELNPTLRRAHSNLAHALSDQGDLDAAMESYRRAVALEPECSELHHYIAIAQLLRGEFSLGWQGYENRWQTKGLRKFRRDFSQPLWRGEPLAGRRILLHAEQGLGDTLHFVRYVPLVAERGGDVLLEVPPELRRVLSGIAGAAEILTRGETLPDFEWHCPLLSLPLAFHTELGTIPANVPYLRTDPAAVHNWSQQLPRGGLRVGLVWAGSPKHTRDPQRSLHVAQFQPLTQIPGASFYSLQKGPSAAQLRQALPGIRLIDLAPQLHDFTDTAALLSTLDLLVTVDTAAAHLAGALGKPVWILLTHTPDWRWLLDREDSPWYPTARLFRQPAPGDWHSVIARVAAELEQLTSLPQPKDFKPHKEFVA
jgi:tetratricopeptide (TPR) repeat protein